MMQCSNHQTNFTIIVKLAEQDEAIVAMKFTDAGTDQQNNLESVKCANICIFKEFTDEGVRTMGECETDLGAAMEAPVDDAHSHFDIGEMDRPAITQGTMQVDTNTSVENTMLLSIINGGC